MANSGWKRFASGHALLPFVMYNKLLVVIITIAMSGNADRIGTKGWAHVLQSDQDQ